MSMLHSFYQVDHSTLWWTVVVVNLLTLCQDLQARYCYSCTPLSFFHSGE